MPRPRKPSHLHEIDGTPNRHAGEPVVELPLVSECPPPPTWLPNGHAVAEWNRLAPILHANKLLTEAGLSALAHVCALHGKIVQLYAAGEAPTASMTGTLRVMMNDFGLTPVAQGKVKPSGDAPKDNPFEGLKGKKPKA